MDDEFLLKFAQSGLTSEEQFKLGVLLKMERSKSAVDGQVTTTFKLLQDWRSAKLRVVNFSASCDILKRACQDMNRKDLLDVVQNEYLSARLKKEREGNEAAVKKFNERMLLAKKELQEKDKVLKEKDEELIKVKEQQREHEDMMKRLRLATAVRTPGKAGDHQRAQEQMLEIMPLVNEVNAMAEELGKHRTFDVVLIPPAAQEGGLISATDTKVMVRMTDAVTKKTWLWDRAKFKNRSEVMQNIYDSWQDGEDVSEIPRTNDPFWAPPEDVLIGTANVSLQPLAYAMDFDDRVVVADNNGHEEGYVSVHLAPTNQNGDLLGDDDFVDDPAELMNKPYHFKVTIKKTEVFKAQFSHGLHVKYRVFKDTAYACTKTITGTLTPVFNHTMVFSFPCVKQEHIDYFQSGYITFLIYGAQGE